MVQLKENNVGDINVLKRRGWEMESIQHLYGDNELKEVLVVFVKRQTKDFSVTINTKSKTIISSKAVSFEDMSLFSKIALEGGFEVDE